jgi:H+/Cl- antiporter ClcA
MYFPQGLGAWLSVMGVGLNMGLVAQGYIKGNEAIKWMLVRLKVSQSVMLPIIGGSLIIGATYAIGNFDYNGLGAANYGRNAVSIAQAFLPVSIPSWSWLIKLILTMVTLSFGFKGGEVTPLFFVGATLGHVLAVYLQLPVALVAGLGLISIFGAAAKVPITTISLGWALFGGAYLPYYILVAYASNWAAGKKGLYD